MTSALVRRTIFGLHYVRAIATIMVVFYHADAIGSHGKYFGRHTFGGALDHPAGEIDLFFMMSGLIMVISTHDTVTMKPRISTYDFLLRRAIRIIPLMQISAVLFCFSIFIVHPSWHFDTSPYLRTFFIWPVGGVSPFTAWTIRYEILFYLVFAATFLYRSQMRLVGIAWFVSPIIFTALGMSSQANYDSLLHFVFSPFNMEFGLGVALGYLYLRFQKTYNIAYQASVLIILIFAIRAFSIEFLGMAHANDFVHAATLAPFCLLVISFALWSEPKSVSPYMMYLGDASYSIFLFHPLIISPILSAFKYSAPQLAPEAVVLITACIGVGLGCIVHVWIEKPLVALVSQRLLPNKKMARQVVS